MEDTTEIYAIDEDAANREADAIALLLPSAMAAADGLRAVLAATGSRDYTMQIAHRVAARVTGWVLTVAPDHEVLLVMSGLTDFLVLARRITATTTS